MNRYGDDNDDDKEEDLARRRAERRQVDGPMSLADGLKPAEQRDLKPSNVPTMRDQLGGKKCSVCGFLGLEHYARGCPECEGRRNRKTQDQTRDAIRRFKAAAEAGDEEGARRAHHDVSALAGRSQADDLARAVAARLAAKPTTRRARLD